MYRRLLDSVPGDTVEVKAEEAGKLLGAVTAADDTFQWPTGQ
jgi:hypothetical protein